MEGKREEGQGEAQGEGIKGREGEVRWKEGCGMEEKVCREMKSVHMCMYYKIVAMSGLIKHCVCARTICSHFITNSFMLFCTFFAIRRESCSLVTLPLSSLQRRTCTAHSETHTSTATHSPPQCSSVP